MKIKKLSVAVSAALVVAYLPAHGEDEGLGGAPEVKLRGFGTIGVVRSTNSKTDVMDNLSQPRGAGYSHKWDFGVDSKLALQADAKFNNRFSASWQVMSQRRYDDSYRPHTEMGFAKLQVTPDISVRLGRVPAPLFMVSEFRKVGYVNPWVRQPNEVYFQVPYTSVDGGDISYQTSMGDFTASIQVATGTMTKAIVPSEGYMNSLRGADGFSSNFIGEYGPVTFRLGYSRTHNSYTGDKLDSLYGGLGKIASYGNDVSANTVGAGKFQNNKGMPGIVYSNIYNSVVQGNIVGSDNFQKTLAERQAQNPNLSAETLTNIMLTSGDPTISAGLASAAAGANISAGTYMAATQKPGGAALQDGALKRQADMLYDQYATLKAKGEFIGAGVIIDPGSWLIESEYTIRKTESFLADSRGWYITGGYRFGRVMPYVRFSELKVTSRIGADNLVDQYALGALQAAGVDCYTNTQYKAAIADDATRKKLCFAPQAVVNSLSTGTDKTVQGTSYGQKNVSLGMRWDFLKSAALKLQWDRVDTSDYPRGTMQNYVHTDPAGNTVLSALGDTVVDPATGTVLKTEFDKSKPVNVFSIAVDFVF